MLILLHKEDQKIRLESSNIKETENLVQTSNYDYYVDINSVDKEALKEDIINSDRLFTYLEIEALTNGNFFVVIFDKKTNQLFVYKDKSGIKSGYYHHDEKQLIIGTNVHEVAKKASTKHFNKKAIYKFVYGDFLFDGTTIYDSVKEFKRGTDFTFDGQLTIQNSKEHKLELEIEENKSSEEENIRELRNQIVRAHKGYLCEKNNVLLSGGIDSVAMLVALDDLTTAEKIHNISYKVKDTVEDETHYAKSVADHLDTSIEIKEVDSDSEENFSAFEEKVLNMNNPYVGMWIFGNFKGTPHEMFYAGQDTRLHTPSVNPIDRIAFSLVKYKNNILVKLLVFFASISRSIITLFNYKKNRYLKEMYKASYVFDVEKYINKYYFKLDEKEFNSYGFPKEVYNELENYFKIDYSKIKSGRALYNKIVELKWSEQYVNDIRYLQDVAKLNNTYIAMPFYLEEIAKFSASIPFSLSIKTMMGRGRFDDKRKRIVKKYILRQALRDKINDKVFYRAKAVSSTMYLLFNGKLGDLIRKELQNDLHHPKSFIKTFNLNNFIDRFIHTYEWQVEDEEYLLKIYHLGILSIYNRKVLQ